MDLTSMIAAGGVERTRYEALSGTRIRSQTPREGKGGGSVGANVTILDHYMLNLRGFRPQLVSIIILYGPGAMGTVRRVRMEHLHPDLYTPPPTEVDVIKCTARRMQHPPAAPAGGQP